MKIRLWTLGNLEHKIVPTKESIQKLRDILAQNNDGEYQDLVWGPELSVTVLEESPYKSIFDEIEKEIQRLNSLELSDGKNSTRECMVKVAALAINAILKTQSKG